MPGSRYLASAQTSADASHRPAVIVEPDADAKLLVVVTVYEVSND